MMIVELLIALAMAVSEQPTEVSLCELTASPERYHLELIVVPAMFHLGFGILFDPECNGRDHWVSVAENPQAGFDGQFIESPSEVVTGNFIGRFHGPNGYGYEHLGSLRTELEVFEARVLQRVRRPRELDYDAPSPQISLRKAIEELDRRWMFAATKRDVELLQEILSKDYVAILPNGEMLAGPSAVHSMVLPHDRSLEAMIADGSARPTVQVQPLVFLIDRQTVVSMQIVSLIGVANEPSSKWEYLNIYRKTGDQWRLAFSRFIRVGADPN